MRMDQLCISYDSAGYRCAGQTKLNSMFEVVTKGKYYAERKREGERIAVKLYIRSISAWPDKKKH